MGMFNNVLNVSKKGYRHRVQRAIARRLRNPETGSIFFNSQLELPFEQSSLVPVIPISIDNFVEPSESLHDCQPSEADDSPDVLIESLRHWAHDFTVPQVAVSSLLKILDSNGVTGLPLDCRTLVGTPKYRDVCVVSPGTYCHIGLFKALDVFMKNCSERPSELTIDVNIDGVPISQITNDGFWLILARVNAAKFSSQIYVIGAYQGKRKPKVFSEFLMPFIEEAKEIGNYKFEGVTVVANIRFIVCDATARNYCLGTKSFNGYYGCGRCSQKGVFKKRMTYPDINAPKRTNASFRTQSQPEHHNVDSPFLELAIDMIIYFPLDYLHTVCLGVVKRILYMWRSGDTRSMIGSQCWEIISERLILISKFQPSEFQRKCRSLQEISNFKGTEFRSLIMYLLPIVTKNVLPDNKYNNILLLHVAFLILVDPKFSKTHTTIAQKLLEDFVRSFLSIYGSSHLVYNVHSLVHIVDDVNSYGTLDSYSAFPFESYMSKVKKMIHKKNQTLAQLCNRVEESYKLHKPSKLIIESSSNVTFKKKDKTQTNVFKEIIFNDFKVNNNIRDQWFMSKDREVYKFDSCNTLDRNISCYQLKNKREFFNLPISSELFDIYISNGKLSSSLKSVPIDNVKCKIFAMPLDNDIVFAPLRHTNI